jgi:CheY-like chemotaxis protein
MVESETNEKWVLIVDDEESILSVLKNSLKKLGSAYQVVTANSGEAALDQLKQRSFDLVVTDYRMGNMNGLELLEAIQGVQPGTRVILMTAYGSSEIEAQARHLQAYRYLTKPLEIKTFRGIIQEALGEMAISRPGILILSDERYRQVNTLLSNLQGDVGARCIFLTDADGRLIAQTGDMANLPFEQMASLVGGGVASLIEVGRIMDGDEDTVNLCYREGRDQNLYVVNIGNQLLMIIICDRGLYSSKLGSVWYYAQHSALELRQKLGEDEHASPYPVLGEEVTQELEVQFDQLFAEKTAPIDQDQAATPATQESTTVPTEQELLSFEQALERGILPDEFTNSSQS